jgi:hypothetical protein
VGIGLYYHAKTPLCVQACCFSATGPRRRAFALNRSGGSRNKHPKAALRQGDVMTIALATVFILGTLTLLVAGYLTATAEY